MKNGRKYSSKVIKDIVIKSLEYKEKIELSDVIEIIRPLYAWKKDYLVERELKKTARAIMRSFKDKEGIRTYYSRHDGMYINIERSTDFDDLNIVNKQLKQKYAGLSAAIEKVRQRIISIVDKYKGANNTGKQQKG